MINIISTPLSYAEMLAVLEESPRTPLLPAIGDPVWKEFANRPVTTGPWIDSIRAVAMQEIDEVLPVLTDELYADFYATGIRLNFEVLYFERRRRLARAVLIAACDGLSSPMVASAVNKLEDIFNEVSWALPAHVGNASGKDPRNIDLFAAETANLMGQCLDILHPVLTDEFITKIKTRLRHDVFENYLENNANFVWTEISNNWNAVCHQGITGAALAAESDLTIVAKILCEVARHLPTCLNSYTADGGCTEGPGYWEYGFGWFIYLNQQLEKRTGGRLSLVEGDEHIKKIARYGVNVSLSNGYVVNFSDSSCRPLNSGAELQSYLGKRFMDDECRKMGIFKYQKLVKNGLSLKNARCDLFYFSRLFFNCPLDLSENIDMPIRDNYMPELAVMIARSNDKDGNLWEFASKGGDNNEHHNHNDCGNFILNLNGKRAVIDIGAPEYVRDFFSHKRYEFLAARTKGHSLAIINGYEQEAGTTFTAEITKNDYSETELSIDINLTKCYKPDADCLEYIRSYRFNRVDGELYVTDNFVLTEVRELETAVITLPQGSDNLALFTVIPDDNTVFAPDEFPTYNDHSGHPIMVRRIVLKPKQLAKTVSIGYCLRII